MATDGASTTEVTMIERLVRIETQLAMVLLEIGPRHTDYEMRLRKVEAKLYIMAGAGIVGGGTLGTLFAHLTGA